MQMDCRNVECMKCEANDLGHCMWPDEYGKKPCEKDAHDQDMESSIDYREECGDLAEQVMRLKEENRELRKAIWHLGNVITGD